MADGELAEAFDAIEADYQRQWGTCFEPDERERLWLALQVTKKVRQHFADMVAEGRVADWRAAEQRRVAPRR